MCVCACVRALTDAQRASGCECLLSMASRRAVPSVHDSIAAAGGRARNGGIRSRTPSRQLRAGIQLLDLCEHVAAGQTRGEWSEIQVCACVRETRQSSEDNDTTQCSLSRLAQLSTSSLLSWALGNEESCISLSEQVAHRDKVQPSGNAAVRLESPHTRVHTR